MEFAATISVVIEQNPVGKIPKMRWIDVNKKRRLNS